MFLGACGEKEETDTGTIEDISAVDTEDTDTEETDTDTGAAEITNEIFAEFSDYGGCGDYFLYAKNADDTVTLHIQGQGLAQQAHEAGGELEFNYDINLEDPSVQPFLVLKMGSSLNAQTCTDVFEQEPQIASEYQVVSGSVSLMVTPEGEATEWGEYPSVIDVTLIDVCFGESDPICVEAFGFAAFVGWMPGK